MTEIQDFYAKEIYGTSYDRCSLIERERIDEIIRRKKIRGEIE